MLEAKLIQVIRTDLRVIGRGVEGSPRRAITQYWLPDGTLLAEVDPWAKEAVQMLVAALGKVSQATRIVGGQAVLSSTTSDLTFMKQAMDELSVAVGAIVEVFGD